MTIMLALLEAVAAAVSCLLVSRRLVHTLQLESYQLQGYRRSLRRRPAPLLLPPISCAIAGWLAALLFRADAAGALAALIAAAGWFAAMRRQKEKKPLVLTERVRRLLAVHAALVLLIAVTMRLLLPGWTLALLPAFEPMLLMLSAKAAEPMERRINRQFMMDAKALLDAMPGLIRIGITGSYGKTSTKFILAELLSARWRVLATPGSFNTTMGVTRVIREMMTPGCQVLIAEMGARHPGDIRELCELVSPEIGMITSIGPQHLDTFGSVETVAETKNELILALPKEGTAVFARDGAWCDRLFEACTLQDKYQSGDLVAAENIETGPWGTRFTLTDVRTGERASCRTALLGRHAVDNLLLCCQVARRMGMTLPELAAGIARVAPVEHRLELRRAPGGITVIDDAFNSNPAGARAAMETLAAFTGRRIVVTPGMVELGKDEASFNRAFGREMAAAAEICILVGGRHADPIEEGLLEAGFNREAILRAGNLGEATALLSGMLREGDVVLYENDLPDNYEG